MKSNCRSTLAYLSIPPRERNRSATTLSPLTNDGFPPSTRNTIGSRLNALMQQKQYSRIVNSYTFGLLAAHFTSAAANCSSGDTCAALAEFNVQDI